MVPQEVIPSRKCSFKNISKI